MAKRFDELSYAVRTELGYVLYAEIVEKIREAIIAGNVKRAEPLGEMVEWYCENVGVSGHILRNELLMLRGLGVVEVHE